MENQAEYQEPSMRDCDHNELDSNETKRPKASIGLSLARTSLGLLSSFKIAQTHHGNMMEEL
ncbi:hypothetical protein V1477_014872, partial [Vespula maculifrons]